MYHYVYNLLQFDALLVHKQSRFYIYKPSLLLTQHSFQRHVIYTTLTLIHWENTIVLTPTESIIFP